MTPKKYDLIVIGCGSGGLSVGLAMGAIGMHVLMISKSDHDIGGDCLNDGCIPSKALIHIARVLSDARQAVAFGLSVSGKPDLKKIRDYVRSRQGIIREHENADWLRKQGVDVVLGPGTFSGADEVTVNGSRYRGKKIIIATGSVPVKLAIPGLDKVAWYDNESIFDIATIPEKLIVIGAGPLGIEMAQIFNRLGSKVTIVQKGNRILPHDDDAITCILLDRLQAEGINVMFNASPVQFLNAGECEINTPEQIKVIAFNAVFVAAGRTLSVPQLSPETAGIAMSGVTPIVDAWLRTSNKRVYVCGDAVGDLQFSHAAEFHARIILNNFFSPFKKRLNNEHLSWVTFTDPEVGSFGMNEQQLHARHIRFERLEHSFEHDDRAITDNYQYGKLLLFIGKKHFFGGNVILGGSMVAPGAGELIQELILANLTGLSLKHIFNKIYPYPTGARINQQLVVQFRKRTLTKGLKVILQKLFQILN